MIKQAVWSQRKLEPPCQPDERSTVVLELCSTVFVVIAAPLSSFYMRSRQNTNNSIKHARQEVCSLSNTAKYMGCGTI